MSSEARAQLLFLCVTLERERDQAIEQAGIRQAACRPHLRVHADRREPGDRVHFVEVPNLTVGCEEVSSACEHGETEGVAQRDCYFSDGSGLDDIERRLN